MTTESTDPRRDEHAAEPLALRLSDQLGLLAEGAGMVNFLNHGAASHVYSDGCNGVTQEHLERFAALVKHEVMMHCAKLVAGNAGIRNDTGEHCSDLGVMLLKA